MNFGWEEDKGERLTLKKTRYGTQLELIGKRERNTNRQTEGQAKKGGRKGGSRQTEVDKDTKVHDR